MLFYSRCLVSGLFAGYCCGMGIESLDGRAELNRIIHVAAEKVPHVFRKAFFETFWSRESVTA